LRQGLGRDLQKLLVRTVRVPKAHEQSATGRPRIDELVDSLEWQGDFGSDLDEIILVDDVVTRGTTFLAARNVIHQVEPWLDVKGFAAVRTMSFEVVTEPLSPATGVVELGGRDGAIETREFQSRSGPPLLTPGQVRLAIPRITPDAQRLH